MNKFLLSAGAVLIALGMARSADAHTVSYGYVPGTNNGEVTFWMGSYHLPSEGGTSLFEGQIDLTGILSTVYPLQSFNFTMASTSLPTGLVSGTNYFVLPGTSAVNRWQGVTLTGLNPGDYNFNFVCNSCTQVWDEWTAGALNQNFSLGAQDIAGGGAVPIPAALPLFGTGIALGGVVARRRRRAAAA